MRALFEHQIHGEWRACTGCHVSNMAWGLTAQPTRSWLTPTQQLAGVSTETGFSPLTSSTGAPSGQPPRTASGGPSAARLNIMLGRVVLYLQALGPNGYRVLPENEFGQDRSPAEMRAAVDRAIAQRITDYKKLAAEIQSGQVDYRECRPVIDDLLSSAPPGVRSAVQRELDAFDRLHAIEAVAAQVAGAALLLLVVFPPTSAFAIGIGAAAGTTLVATGTAKVSRGAGLSLAEGANDVVAPELQRQGAGMVVGGVMDMVSGALAIAGSFAGLRARIMSEGRIASGAIVPAGTQVRGEFTFTFGADGQSYVVTSVRYPGCFVIVDADGATGFQVLQGRVIRVGQVPWNAAGVEASPAASGAAASGTQALATRPPGLASPTLWSLPSRPVLPSGTAMAPPSGAGLIPPAAGGAAAAQSGSTPAARAAQFQMLYPKVDASSSSMAGLTEIYIRTGSGGRAVAPRPGMYVPVLVRSSAAELKSIVTLADRPDVLRIQVIPSQTGPLAQRTPDLLVDIRQPDGSIRQVRYEIRTLTGSSSGYQPTGGGGANISEIDGIVGAVRDKALPSKGQSQLAVAGPGLPAGGTLAIHLPRGGQSAAANVAAAMARLNTVLQPATYVQEIEFYLPGSGPTLRYLRGPQGTYSLVP